MSVPIANWWPYAGTGRQGHQARADQGGPSRAGDVRVNPVGSTIGLFDLGKVSSLPASVERWLVGALDADIGEPGAAGNGLDKASLLSLGGGGAEVEVDRIIALHVLQFEVRTQGRLFLVGLNFGACLSVVDGHRPEELSGNRLRDRQLVGLATVEPCVGAVARAQ